MNKLLTIILGSTLLLGGCAGKDMKTKVDDLTKQVATLTEEKEKLEIDHQKDERNVELLCAIVGEQATMNPITGEAAVEYLGDEVFRHVQSGQIHKLEGMVERCLEMVDSFDNILKERSVSLLKEDTKSK